MVVAAKQYLIAFDPERCIQCHGCETACKMWRDVPYGLRLRRVLNLWEGRYPAVTSRSLSLACLHCADPACVAVCPAEALAKDPADGRVLVDATRCVGCGACARACPFGVPQIGPDKIMRKCDLCFDQALGGAAPPCVDTCPGKALALVAVTPREKQAAEAAVAALLARSGETPAQETPSAPTA